jgi:carotenoid cleavage dioxygenase-like enzyme
LLCTSQLLVAYHDSITLDLDARCTDGVPCPEQPRLARITLDPSSGSASLVLLTNVVGDFPTINNNYTGRKCRYAYVATMFTKGTTVKFDGVAKIDLQAGGIEKEVAEGAAVAGDAAVGRIKLPEGCWNGETVFVPR